MESILKRIIIDSVRPGDIVFTARPGKISKSIRIATNGVVSHAMICVQHGSFIDSTADGVQARSFQRELFEDDEQVFHFRVKKSVNPETLAKIVDFARAEVGARYSVAEAVRSVAAVKKPRSRRQFCSRLVARVYQRAGFDLVPDADYCSPEDLRRSPLLIEVPIETESVSDEEIRWRDAQRDPILATHNAQNVVLDVARSFKPDIENFDDLFSLLVQRPDVDQTMADALRDSGYLDIWKLETEAHPGRYDSALIDTMISFSQMSALREYCIGTIKEAYSGGLRYAINLIQLRTLQSRYPRRTFCLEIELYEILVRNDQARREVAYNWLSKHHPDDLKQHIEQIEPHSALWYSIIDRVEPNLAALSRRAVATEGSKEVCSSCGDVPATSYRLVNGAETMPGVPSLRLCEDCIEIRRGMNNVLIPFLR